MTMTAHQAIDRLIKKGLQLSSRDIVHINKANRIMLTNLNTRYAKLWLDGQLFFWWDDSKRVY